MISKVAIFVVFVFIRVDEVIILMYVQVAGRTSIIFQMIDLGQL